MFFPLFTIITDRPGLYLNIQGITYHMVVDLDGLDKECKNHVVLFCIQSKEPIDFDPIVKLDPEALVSSPPCDFKFTEEDATKYIKSAPLLFLLSEDGTNYASYNLDITVLKEKFPELYEHLTVTKGIKF
jgi:hypothetical protein